MTQFSAPETSNALTPRQESAIPYIVAAPSIRQAARNAGVGRSTIIRWMQDPAFRAELDRAREAASSLVHAKLQELLLHASANLESFLSSPDPAVQLRATRLAFDIGLKAELNHDLRKRVDLLNAALYRLKQMQ